MCIKLGYLQYTTFVWNLFETTFTLFLMFLITNYKANDFSCEIILSRQSPASGRWHLHPYQRSLPKLPFYQRFYLRSREQNIMTLSFVMVARTLDFLWCLIEGLTNSLVHYQKKNHVKNVHIWCFSGPYFPAYQLNIERYFVFLRIHSKCGKVWIRKTPNMDIFHAVFRLVFSQY